MEQSVGANLDKPFRQYMRKKAPDEGVYWQRGSFVHTGFALDITERDRVICHLLDAVVPERDAEDVGRKLLQGAQPAPNRPAVDDPRLGPSTCVNLAPQRRLAHPGPELCPKEIAKRFDMKEKIAVPDLPARAVWRESKRWHQIW
jgi:hypothetical protein